jgi:CRP/FNR family cyclic AMP-dependent transcriptional regulator
MNARAAAIHKWLRPVVFIHKWRLERTWQSELAMEFGSEIMTSEPFISRLDENDRAALEQRWAVTRFARSQMVISHDEQSRDVFFVLEGRARATIYSAGGVAVAYRDIEPGGVFGELAAIDGRPRSASVAAVEPLRVARLSEVGFRDLVNTRPGFRWMLLDHLVSQVRRMTDRVFEFSTLVVRKRLIRELLRLANAAHRSDGEASILQAPTHADLAARISTQREAVSREMSALAKRKLIVRSGDALVLCDLAALKKIGRDDEG